MRAQPFLPEEMDGDKAGKRQGHRGWHEERYPNYLPEANFNHFSKPNHIEIKNKKQNKKALQ